MYKYENFREILQRMIDFLYSEYGVIATLEDAYYFARIREDFTGTFYMTRDDLQEVLDGLNIDAELSAFIDV